MKKFFLLATSALLLLAGCAKEVSGPAVEGGLQEVTFTASMAGDATRAAVDGDGNAANVNRCIMEIYYDGSLFERKYAEVTGKVATFSTQLVAGRTYTVAFWADSVASRSALETDLYYTTNAEQPNGGLQAIALKGTYVGNNDARDAFFSVADYVIAQGGTACQATLYRPFAQINVITTDWDKSGKIESIKPGTVDVTITNPMTKFNAVTGVASADANVPSLNYNAVIYTSPASGTDATLSMDYLFAAADKAVIDIAWKAQHGTDADISHSFSNIPYQRNYRTNIKGNLLTSQGQWTVTVDPVWESSKTGEEEFEYVVVGDIKSANVEIASQLADGQSAISVKFTSQPNDAGTPGSTSAEGVTCNSILTTNLPEDGTLNILVEAQTKDLYVGDYVSETSQEVKTTDVNDAVVNINIPANSSIQKLVVNAPSKTVYVNGIEVASGGVVDLDAITSENTLIIAVEQTVGTLTIRQGGLEIHGTVNAVTIPEGHGAIYVRSCEGLSKSVYDVLEPYIDIDNGYVGEKESGKETYRVYQKAESEKVAQIGDVKFYTLNAAFAAVKDGETITLIKDCETGASYSETNMLALTVANVTLDLNEKTITETNNFSFVIAGNNDIVKNGNIVSGYNSAKDCEYHSYAMVVGGKTTADKVTGVQIKDVTFTGGVSIGGSTEGNEADYQGPAEVTIDGCTITSGDFYIICAQPKNLASVATVLSGTYNYAGKYGAFCAEDGCTISLKGGTYDADPSDYVADGYEAVKEGDVWVVSTIKVAKIGETKYETLAAAFEAVQDGQTIELLKDCNITSAITVDKNVTLDLDEHTITCGVSEGRPLLVKSNTTFTVKDGVFADGVSGASYGVIDTRINNVAQENVTINVSNVDFGVFDANGDCTAQYNTDNGAMLKFRSTGVCSLEDVRIGTNHYIFDHQGAVQTTVKDSKFVVVHDNTDGCSNNPTVCNLKSGGEATLTNVEIQATNCYACTYGAATLNDCIMSNTSYTVTTYGEKTVTINGGTYSGANGTLRVLSSGGEIIVNGGTFTGTGYVVYADSRNAKETVDNDAYVILNSGTVTGNVGMQHKGKFRVHGGVVNGNATLSGEGEPIEADGGTFSFDPATTCVSGSTKAVKIADGYKAVDNGNNTWTIKPTTPTTGTTPDLSDWK